MKRNFLIGRFLQSHASVYRYDPRPSRPKASLPLEVLRRRFGARARRFHAERNRYAIYLQASLAAAVLVVIGAFNLDIQPRESELILGPPQELVTINEILQTRQDVKPPPPPRPQVPVEVPNDEIIEDDDLMLDIPFDLTDPLPLPPPPKEEKPEDDANEIFLVVEEMPTLIGGIAALSADITYPMIARRAGIEGMVVVRVVIEDTGVPSTPVVIQSAHEILDKAAVEAVLKQRFTPGRQRGRAVRTHMAIPVRFALERTD